MPVIPLPRAWQPNDIIPAQWGNNVGLDFQVLDVRTGGDPGVADRFLVSNGAASSLWRALRQADFGAGIIPSSALIDRKVNTLNPNYPTFAAAVAGGSHFFDVGAAPDGPTPSSFMAMQLRNWNYAAGDYHVTLAVNLYDVRELYIQGVVGGTPSPWYKLFHSGNGGVNSGIDADKLQGKTPGHGTGQIPINDGVVNPNLNAGLFGGQAPAYYATAAQVAAVWTADMIVIWPNQTHTIPVGWVQETNLNGRFPMGSSGALPGTPGGGGPHAHGIRHTHPKIETEGSNPPGGPVQSGGGSSAGPSGHVHAFQAPYTLDGTVSDQYGTVYPPFWVVLYIRKT